MVAEHFAVVGGEADVAIVAEAVFVERLHEAV